MGTSLSRRRFLQATGVAALGAVGACRRAAPGAGGGEAVTVYCSADAEYAGPVFEAFTAATGIRVDAVLDTEATKTTGLVNRLLSERGSPKADAWWSSEPFGTIKLARAGVLARFRAAKAEEVMRGSRHGRWPEELRDVSPDAVGTSDAPLWYGFGERLRVMVYNAERVELSGLPLAAGRLGLLTHSRFKGRVAIARPQFGTTRGHMAMLRAQHGDAALRAWLGALKANDVQILDGNATVVRTVASGKAHIGLTDSDDVFAGKRQGWPVEMMFEPFGTADTGTGTASPDLADLPPMGPPSLPNTCAVIAGPRRVAAAGAFIEHLLSPATQRLLAASDSRNVPVDEGLRRELASWVPPVPEGARAAARRLEDIEASIEPAMVAVGDVLGA
ncbi:MAG: extracellular solute-binding protein [Phycisphaerales bacterium]|nr:extracellular solute-binding protein [Phycisphaerales bacterium]